MRSSRRYPSLRPRWKPSFWGWTQPVNSETDNSAKRNQSSQTADHVVVNYLPCGARAPTANQQSRSGAMLRSGVGGSLKRTTESWTLQRYRERIEKLSQQDRVSKFCTDAGFLTTVEVGQYFMTKDAEEFWQFTESVACREYTLPREEDTSKYGDEIRISFVNRDNTHSWVRIFHGSNKFVMNLNNNEQELPEVQLEEYVLKLVAKDFACRS